jgi:lycopene beta-cyclase
MLAKNNNWDVILVGGGLVNSLLAWQLKKLKPWISFIVLEKAQTLGGKHTWSFHEKDVSAEALQWLRPVLSASWPFYQVAFPKYERKIQSRYFSIRSKKFHDVLLKDLAENVLFDAEVAETAEGAVVLKNGKRMTAKVVIDGRGQEPVKPGTCAFQKFVGLEVQLIRPHGLQGPILMDATVEQKDGYRFLYCLPWSENRLLVEDTRYSTNPDIDSEEYRREVLNYCAKKNWQVGEVFDEESGCLPLPVTSSFQKEEKRGPLLVGMRGGLFHSTTGYSFPDAVRTVELLVNCHSENDWRCALENFSQKRKEEQRFFQILNRVMFGAVPPLKRYRFLQHFYQLPEPLMACFYSGQMGFWDKVRFFLRTPPVSLGAAWRTWNKESVYGN